MRFHSIRTTSSQRWAAGAIGLALLSACSPNTPQPEAPKPPEPQASTATVEPASVEAPPPVAAAGPPPGYAGNWAQDEASCADPTKLMKLSGQMLDLTPEARACQVKSI